MNTEAFLAAQFARPLTHRVTTVYEGGATHVRDTRSEAQAENWAIGERRKIGRDLISRETGETSRVVAVMVDAL